MRDAFPDALVCGHESLIAGMKNHANDRHVLAAAIKCGAHAIISNNKKHFPNDLLLEFDLECLTADEFIEHQYHLNPDALISTLIAQARDINRPLSQLLSHHVPCLSRLIQHGQSPRN